MEAHLRLHFNNAESSDENVLNIYPTPLRKRILRFLYLKKLEECYLFKGCKPKLLDALLGSATVHLFMPKVQLVVTHARFYYSAAGGPAEICHFPALCPRSGNNIMLGEGMLGASDFCWGQPTLLDILLGCAIVHHLPPELGAGLKDGQAGFAGSLALDC